MVELTRRNAVFGAAGVAALTSLGAARAEEIARPRGAWTQLRNMPFPVQEIYPVAHKTLEARPGAKKPQFRRILVNAGGLTPSSRFEFNVSDAVSIFDPRAGRWRAGPSLPYPMHHPALVSNSGRIMSIGGFRRDDGGGWRMENRVWELDDLETGNWVELPALAIPQAEVVAASVNGRVHVVGGRSPAGSVNLEWGDHIDTDQHWMFVASENRWERRRPLPSPRNSSAGAVYSEALYVIAGRTVAAGNTPRVDVYDPVSDRWQKAAPLPKGTQAGAPLGRGGLAAAEWNGYIYAFGGEWFGSGGGVYSEVFEYDPREDKWRSVASMPRPRHGLGAVALDDGVYVVGGASQAGGNGTTATLDRFSI